MITPNTEVIVQKRSFKLNSKSSQIGMRLLEPCLNWHLQQKRTLCCKDSGWSYGGVVPLRVFNVSNEVFHFAAETVISLAKSVIDATSLNEENQESAMDQAGVMNEHVSEGAVYTTPPKVLRGSTNYLTDSETERRQELLFNYKHVFSISDKNLGTTHMVQHRIETSMHL